MTKSSKFLSGLALVSIALTTLFSLKTTTAGELDGAALQNADADPNNWVMYNQSYKSWHFSKLDQINVSNVQNLKVAWSHTPRATKRGIQSFPLVIDGVLYYTGGNSQIYALDGATGRFLWTFAPKINAERANGTLYNTYNRGLAAAYGNLYVGTPDGRAIAVDMKTGKPVWDMQVIALDSSNKGFSGAPLVVKDKVIFGSNGGELSGCCGPIFGLDAKTGTTSWHFDTIGGDDRSRASWGNDSWKTGGGGAWHTGTYDPKTNTVFWGTGNPAPDFDWGAKNWKTDGARPGENLYSSSVIALDPDTGKLKSYFQEIPHDMWDFDSAVGEFVFIERGGKDYIVHPNKSGYVFVYGNDTSQPKLKIENVWKLSKTANFVKTIDQKTGELIDRTILSEGEHKDACPHMDGGISWNNGSYSPVTGLYYKVGQEYCMDVEVVKGDRPKDYSGQLYIGASVTAKAPPGRATAFGHVSGRDPITGKPTWDVEYKYPPLASLLSTQGGLLFVPGADGWLDALDAQTGKKLWTHNNGIGHHGGVISYSINGKQYIAVLAGWGSFLSGSLESLYGEPLSSMSKDVGQLIVFSL
jgi:alcohol dehydrogenase (cytochrome c)